MKQNGWYHCGKCGEVYHAEQDDTCPVCARTSLTTKKKANVRIVESFSTSSRKEFIPKHTIERPHITPSEQLES